MALNPPRIAPRAPGRLAAIVAAFALLSLAGAAGAEAAAWVDPATLAGSYPYNIQTRQNSVGDITAVWDDEPDGCTGAGIMTADRQVDAAWGALHTLDAANCFSSPRGFDMNPAGGAAAVWASSTFDSGTSTYTYHLWAATRASSADAWSAPQEISTNSTTFAMNPVPTVVVDALGNATAIWSVADNSGKWTYDWSAGAVGGGSWSSAAALPGAGNLTPADPVLGLDASGNPIVLLQVVTSSCGLACFFQHHIYASELTGSGWGTPVQVGLSPASTSGATYSINNLRLDRGSAGALAASWELYDSNTPQYSLYVSVLTGGTWNMQVVPGSTSPNYVAPYTAVDSQGKVQAVWSLTVGPCCSQTFELHTATFDGSSWTAGSPDPLPIAGPSGSQPYLSDRPVVFDANDNAVLVDVENGSVYGRVRPAGSNTWGAAEALNSVTNPSDAVVSADQLGNVAGTWADGINGVLEGVVHDGGGPAITAFSTPGTGLTGSPLDFSASTADWSPPITYAWDFGDGGSSGDASTSHSYTAPGSYSAGLTATDALGFSRSETANVAVSTPPPPPGPPPAPPPPPPDLPPPVAGVSFDIVPLGGVVFVQEPGTDKFVLLTKPSQIRNGSIIDARKGRVRITIDDGAGHLDTADFYEGIFKFVQENVATSARVAPPKVKFADLYLVGGKFKGCPKAPRHPKIASVAKAKDKSIQHLWGSGHGAFRTVGRYSSATVRGTTWLTDDRCDGTLTRVTSGKVGVRDFVTKKTIVITKGKSYFAKSK